MYFFGNACKLKNNAWDERNNAYLKKHKCIAKSCQFVQEVEVEESLFTALFYNGYNGDEPRIMG